MRSHKQFYNILAINWQDITNPFGGGAEVHFCCRTSGDVIMLSL